MPELSWNQTIYMYTLCVVPENIHTPPPPSTEYFLNLPPRIFDSRGSLMTPPPLPQEFQEFLNGDFASHPLEIQSGFGT